MEIEVGLLQSSNLLEASFVVNETQAAASWSLLGIG
jgi:hypothetical protein